MLPDTRSALHELEQFLAARYPHALRDAKLRPPADPTRRRALALAVGREHLPEALDVWFAWHDGESGTASFLENSADLGGWRLMSTEEALQCISDMKKWRSPGRSPYAVPILESGGDVAFVDVSTGRVEAWWHEAEPSSVVAENLDGFIAIHANAWAERSRREH